MKRVIALILGCSLVCLSGCGKTGTVYSNYRELESMELILSLGFDSTREGVRLSVAGGAAGDEGNGPSPQKITRLATAGTSITAAMERIQDFATKEELFYAHTQYVLMGENYARTQLAMILDYLQGTTGVRTSVPLFVVHGDTAEHLVTSCGEGGSDITTTLNSTILDSRRRGDGYPFSCSDVIAGQYEHGGALIMALKVAPTRDVEPSAQEDAVSPLPDGYAIVHNNTIVDFVPQADARGVNLLLEQPGLGAVTVDDPKAGAVTVNMTRCKVKLEPVWGEDGSVSGVQADIKAHVYLKEVEHPEALEEERVLKAVSEQLEQWVENVLQKMSDTEVDFLGIGMQLRMRHPIKWDRAPRSWEEVLGELEFDAQAECIVARAGELQR